MTAHEKKIIEDIMLRWDDRGTIPKGRVIALAEMARLGIWPDGTFGDDECIIWELFRRNV